MKINKLKLKKLNYYKVQFLKLFWQDYKYKYILPLSLSGLTLLLIYFTIPKSISDVLEFMVIARTLLLALGAGYFGLLGFIVGGFAITSSKMMDLINNENKLKLKFIEDYFYFLSKYKYTVLLLILNIILTFIVFIITCLPFSFNPLIFWMITAVIVFGFYYALFYILILFELGINPIRLQVSLITLDMDCVHNYDHEDESTLKSTSSIMIEDKYYNVVECYLCEKKFYHDPISEVIVDQEATDQLTRILQGNQEISSSDINK
ncbi:hypothetical protein LG311_03205 [Sutcliffiella horikoshii]|uniref:hypothetical protein n=1 Tax=Sutcliffiella horikoshii TaxID=79883 RepID=UPI00384B08B4